jgi:hypothetical protein
VISFHRRPRGGSTEQRAQESNQCVRPLLSLTHCLSRYYLAGTKPDDEVGSEHFYRFFNTGQECPLSVAGGPVSATAGGFWDLSNDAARQALARGSLQPYLPADIRVVADRAVWLPVLFPQPPGDCQLIGPRVRSRSSVLRFHPVQSEFLTLDQ